MYNHYKFLSREFAMTTILVFIFSLGFGQNTDLNIKYLFPKKDKNMIIQKNMKSLDQKKYDSKGRDCTDGYIQDCADEDCCPESWIGDGFADCQSQAYGCELNCYEYDSGE